MPVPVGADVPPTGPVARVFPAGAFAGLGTVNGDDGFAVGAGADIGLLLGLALGGAGFAAEGFFTFEDYCCTFAGVFEGCVFC